jgi:hypothetical protein
MMNATSTSDQEVSAEEPAHGERSAREWLTECIQESLQQANPLQGRIGYETVQLWQLTMLLDEEIKCRLSERSDRMSAFEELAPAVEMLLKLHRQAEGYLKVAAKLASSGPGAAESSRGLQAIRIKSVGGEESPV